MTIEQQTNLEASATLQEANVEAAKTSQGTNVEAAAISQGTNVEAAATSQRINAEAVATSQETLIPSENENEESQSGAFNPETGEINWDCPCLGGMAKGSCGEQFKAAFSCFIYSTAEPKGVDCLEQFQKMRDCFRQHPDEYGEELDDDDDDLEEEAKQIDLVTEEAKQINRDAKQSTITVSSTTESPNTNDKQKSDSSKN